MALFKIYKGEKFPETGQIIKATEGFAYFTSDDGKFYIDISGDGTEDAVIRSPEHPLGNRIPLNAYKADIADKINKILTINLNKENDGVVFDGSENISIKFYAPIVGGTNAQALIGDGVTTTPKWANIDPNITITDGDANNAPKINITVLGQNGTAQAITTATIGIYGVTKLTSIVTLDTIEESLAVTPKGVIDAINRLNVDAVGVVAATGNRYISQISEINGKISAVLAAATIGSKDTPIWINAGTITAITGAIANDITGNANTATAFASDATISLTGDITGYANGTHGWSIETNIGANTVTNTMLAGSITNNKLVNSTIGIAGTNIALGSSIDKTTLLSNLGLTNAAHYIGKATKELTDGGTENPTISGYDFANDRKSGDIVLGKDGDKEYIWGLNGWELLGPVDTIQASTGTGTQNRMAYYSAANMISSSSHYTTDTKVAINKTSIADGYSFEVNGNSIYDGNIRLNNTVLERLIESKKNGGPGWARNIISILDNEGTSFAHIGTCGSANDFTYLYIGTGAYNSADNLRIYSAANGQSEKIAIGRTTVAAAAATLYVKGTPGEFTFRDREITPVATFDGQTYFTGGLNSASYILTNVTNASTAKNVSGDGSYYLYGNNVQYGRLCIVNMGLAPTENEGTYSGASAGHARLILGNSKINANSAEGEADNAYGDVLLYRNNGSYTVYEPAAIYYQNNLENADVFSYQGSKSTTADEDAYATWVLGNSVKKTSTTAHSEGRLRIYSASTGYHQIVGTSTTGTIVHYFPDASGWIVTGGNGTTTGVGGANQIVYLNASGVLTAGTSATNANTANTIVKRDASGNFRAGTITATLSGNANTATKWAAAQKVYVTLGTASTTTTIQGGSTSAQTIGVDGVLKTAHGGTGNNSYTASRLVYSNTATKLATGTIESDGNNIILGDGDYSLSRTARTGNWNQGVSKALIKITSATGAYPLFAMKSHSGYWLMTQYEANGFYNHLMFGFLSDVDVYGVTNAKNHYDYKVRLIPTVYATNTDTVTDRAFVTADYVNNSAQTGNASQPVYVNTDGKITAITGTITNNAATATAANITSTDNAIVRFNGTAGKFQNSTVTIDDNGYINSKQFKTSSAQTILNDTGYITIYPYDRNTYGNETPTPARFLFTEKAYTAGVPAKTLVAWSGIDNIKINNFIGALKGNADTATALSLTGTTGQFWRGDNTWSNELSGGLLKITKNSNTVTIGSANTNYMHFSNSADIPFYFNKTIWVDGDLYPCGTSNTRSLGSSSKRWKSLLIGMNDSYGGTTQPIWWNNGVPAVISANVGNNYTPVYLSSGAITACSSMVTYTSASNTSASGQPARLQAALQSIMPTHNNSRPEAVYLNTGNGSVGFGYFLSGDSYNTTSKAYGGYFIAHYNIPRYQGISGGTWSNRTIVTNSTNAAMGNASKPVYVDADGILQACNAYPAAANTTTAVAAADSNTQGTATTWARSDHNHRLPASGVTAGSYGPSANATPGYGVTFNVPYITVDKYGRVTAASTKTVKIPASDNTNTDTKVNYKLDTTTTKAYVMACTSAPTATATARESVGSTSVYINCSTRVLMGAAWNDYAEFRQLKENKMYATTVGPGRVVYENGDDTLSISTERLMRGCNIVSDTYGFSIGESKKAQLPIAVSGRVLAYPYENKEEFKNHIGQPVCSGPNGTVSIMTEEEEMKYPSRIIGTISAVPDYEIWHGGADVIVDGRVWIKVR